MKYTTPTVSATSVDGIETRAITNCSTFTCAKGSTFKCLSFGCTTFKCNGTF